MKIWLDSTNLLLIQEASQSGILHGIALSAPFTRPQELLGAQKGPVSVLITGPDFAKQAKSLFSLSPRLVPSIPCTKEGLQAIYTLSQEGISTIASCVYELNQVLLAASAGAAYIAPHFHHICSSDMDGLFLIKQMLHLLHRYNFPSKLLATSLKTPEQVKECAEAGVHAVAINDSTYRNLLADNPLTLESIKSLKIYL